MLDIDKSVNVINQNSMLLSFVLVMLVKKADVLRLYLISGGNNYQLPFQTVVT